MRRRIQRKPVRFSRQEVGREKEQSSVRTIRVQDLVGIISSLSGLVVAILWIAGRYYTAAYFGAMNIPVSQISYSVWEYAEAAGPKLFFILVAKTYFPLVVIAISFVATLLSLHGVQSLLPTLRTADAIQAMTARTVQLPKSFWSLLILALILYVTYFLGQVAIEFSRTGSRAGLQAVLRQSYPVDVYSRNAIPSLGPIQTSARARDGFHYSGGLRLLTHNNGKYYFFQEIDPMTCRPKQVFVISDTEDIYLVLQDKNPIHPLCTPAASDQP